VVAPCINASRRRSNDRGVSANDCEGAVRPPIDTNLWTNPANRFLFFF
jgi:hypothetical protein